MPKLALSCTNSSHKKGLLKSRQQMPDSPSLTSAKKRRALKGPPQNTRQMSAKNYSCAASSIDTVTLGPIVELSVIFFM
jgi:hypothetical protein